MSSGRVDCNVHKCPHKYHYSTTNMRDMHRILGLEVGEEKNRIQNSSIQDISNSFVSNKKQNTVLYKLENTSKSMKNLFNNNPTFSTYETKFKQYPLEDNGFAEEFEEYGDKNYMEKIVSKDKIMDTFSNIGGVEVSDEHDNIYSSEEMLKDFSKNIEGFNYNDYDYNDKIENDPDGFIGKRNIKIDSEDSMFYYPKKGEKVKLESFLIENRKKQLAQVSILTSHNESSYTDCDPDLPVDNTVTTINTASTTGIIVKTQEGETTCIPLDDKSKEDGIEKLSVLMNDFQNYKKKEPVKKEDSLPQQENRKNSVNTQDSDFSSGNNKPQNGILNNIKKLFGE